MSRAPTDGWPGASEVEFRPIFELEDFGEAMTDELREQEAHLRGQLADD
ncbi:MAG: hypothetical protein OXH86_13560 [Acidimicrobiaceae bacterium]|nr:hypothetical protein [Acidimicrobiaceae bacterium]MDE0498373.1 hypothetical protein [Acidimicrobiaceae bacterium]